MAQQVIDLGEPPNGIGGDTNRSANVKCNENFTELYETSAAKGDNSDITSLSGLTTPLSIEQGGTGTKDAEAARKALSAAQSGKNEDITELTGLQSPMSIKLGGTGAATARAACQNLGALALGAKNSSYGTLLENGSMSGIATIADSEYQQQGPLTITNNANPWGSCVITFHRIGDFACYFGIDTDNQLKVGGWSMGKVAHRIYHAGNATRAADGTLKVI